MNQFQNFSRLPFWALPAALVLNGCYGASTYTVNTVPAGASVWQDDEYVGESPVTLESQMGWWRIFNSPDIRIEKKGFESLEYSKSVRQGEDFWFYFIMVAGSCGMMAIVPLKTQGGTMTKNGKTTEGIHATQYLNDEIRLVPLDAKQKK